MSRQHAERRIREALILANGNATKARQIITNWCAEDHQLVLEMAMPHMVGIASHAIQRAIRLQAEGKTNTGPVLEEPIREQATIEAGIADAFGLEILKAVADNSNPRFGMNATHTTGRSKSQVSARHIDAIHKMASATKNKNGNGF